VSGLLTVRTIRAALISVREDSAFSRLGSKGGSAPVAAAHAPERAGRVGAEFHSPTKPALMSGPDGSVNVYLFENPGRFLSIRRSERARALLGKAAEAARMFVDR
jgi:hypothetical protein